MILILWHFCTSTGLLRRWPRRTQENFQWLTVKERRYCQDSFYLFCIFVSVSIQSERTVCHTLVTSKKWNFVYTVRRRSIGGHLDNFIFRPLIETAHMRMCSSQHRNAFILLLLVAKCTLSGGKTLALNGFMHKRRNYLSWDVSKQEALEKSVREFQRTRVQKKKQKQKTHVLESRARLETILLRLPLIIALCSYFRACHARYVTNDSPN